MTDQRQMVIEKLMLLAQENDMSVTNAQIDHGASLIDIAITENRKWGVTRMGEPNGLLIITYDAKDHLVDIYKMLSHVQSPFRKIPKKDWLNRIMLPFRPHRSFTTERDLLHKLISTAIRDGGSWVAKVNDHFVEFEIKDFTDNVINTITVRKAG